MNEQISIAYAGEIMEECLKRSPMVVRVELTSPIFSSKADVFVRKVYTFGRKHDIEFFHNYLAKGDYPDNRYIFFKIGLSYNRWLTDKSLVDKKKVLLERWCKFQLRKKDVANYKIDVNITWG